MCRFLPFVFPSVNSAVFAGCCRFHTLGFAALVRRYSEISELTYENVHEFIDRILVHKLDRETNS